jgi:hypothetical protein
MIGKTRRGAAGDKAVGALFVFMGMVENSTEPEALANAAKHFAFTHCGELPVWDGRRSSFNT